VCRRIIGGWLKRRRRRGGSSDRRVLHVDDDVADG